MDTRQHPSLLVSLASSEHARCCQVSSMLFYCEHLEQIKVCHLHVQLDSAADAETSLTVFDRKTLRLRHGFRSFALSMPASIDTEQKLQLKFDTERSLDRYSFSVRIKSLSSLALPNAGANPVPLSDPPSLKEMPLLCTTCQAILLPAGLTWRHLPSEHWQEMMDSWHCHAGVSQHNGHERHEQYTLPANIVDAAQGIMPVAGKPLIGLSHFLVDPTDVATSTSVDNDLVHCQACQSPCGVMQGSAIKLYKHVLHTPSNMRTDPLIFFAADLLAQVEAHAVHRFLITPYDKSIPDQAGLLLWFMAVDMYVTSSSAVGIQRAIKVLVRNSTLADLEGLGQTQQEVEPVSAPLPGLFEHLEQTLDRHFQEAGRQVTGAWRASYLPRYAGEMDQDERAVSFES